MTRPAFIETRNHGFDTFAVSASNYGGTRYADPSLMNKHGRAARYLAAFIIVLAAFSLTLSARSLFETTSYALFLAAVMFTSLYGGLTPALIVIVLSVVALDRYFVPAPLSGVLSRDDVAHVSIFLLVAGIINHLNRARLRAEEALHKSHDELQSRVEERTEDLKHANGMLRQLSGQLLHFQDEERRRTAQLLHETVAQSLAVLKMDLAVVRRSVDRNGGEATKALDEALSLTQDCIREVRTVSYLLHPPLLDEAGLSLALQWYVAGFQQRSGIKIELNLQAELGRLSGDMEMTIFRIVQECLTNIHRHSGSSSAGIIIHKTPSDAIVEISDQGHGMKDTENPAQAGATAPYGVGIMGMRERVKHLGGTMEIESGSRGTTVRARFPYDRVAA